MTKKKLSLFWTAQQCIEVMCAMDQHHAKTGMGADINTECPICKTPKMNYENRLFYTKEAVCRTCDASLQRSIAEFSK